MNYQKIVEVIGNVDIYVIDQILKQRYLPTHKILDAGCGSGRNLKWFYNNTFDVSGIDLDAERITEAKKSYPKSSENFSIGSVDHLPYTETSFDHIICCAVLHFAQSETHFTAMFSELVRVLKPNGTLLVRMASNIGLDGKAPFVQDGLSNQNGNYYLTRARIVKLLEDYRLELLEPIKTTNVQDIRAMTTLVLQK